MKFLCLDQPDNKPVFVNIKNIGSIHDPKDGEGAYVEMKQGGYVRCTNSVSEIIRCLEALRNGMSHLMREQQVVVGIQDGKPVWLSYESLNRIYGI